MLVQSVSQLVGPFVVCRVVRVGAGFVVCSEVGGGLTRDFDGFVDGDVDGGDGFSGVGMGL